MSQSNEIDIEIELDNGQLITYNVEYDISGGCAERRYGHPDDWHDAEGPEIDITGVSYERPLNKEELVKFLNQHEDYVIEKIIKQEGQYE